MHIPQFPKEPINLDFVSKLTPPSQWKNPKKDFYITAEQATKRPQFTRRESWNEMR